MEINREGLPCGKFQIDSKWEKNYGDLEPDLERLSSFAATVKLLKELGCEAVSLAVHPYVHLSSRVAVAKNFRYFVKGKNGLPIEFQWRGATTYRIDTTSFTAVEW